MQIHSFKLLSDNVRLMPKLIFRGKNIENLDQFPRGGISVSWTGDPEVVDNGVKTVPGTYGMFNEQIMQEVLADAKDYGIDITIHRSVANKFKVNEYKVGE